MMGKRLIPVAAPALVGNEKKYVLDCLKSTWISSSGEYIERFETEFAKFCCSDHAIACTNGTVALHLALLALGVERGDEVIIPTLAFVAVANAVAYCGAVPVFVDSENQTWNMDPSALEGRISSKTKGIIAVHLYGHPVDMDPVLSVAKRHGLFVIEDGAEAHGAEYKGRKVGSLANVSTFSFYGNKIISTGEGGIVLTDDIAVAERVRRLKGQGMDPERRYWFPTLGYNYRMTNLAAAIGLAQVEKIDWHLQRRHEVAEAYRDLLGDNPMLRFQPEMPWAKHAYWMVSVVLDSSVTSTRDEVMEELHDMGIETRPFFYPIHKLPIYQSYADLGSFPVAEDVAARGLNLPTSALLSKADIKYVSSAITRALS
jgi:perosamine synthetase